MDTPLHLTQNALGTLAIVPGAIIHTNKNSNDTIVQLPEAYQEDVKTQEIVTQLTGNIKVIFDKAPTIEGIQDAPCLAVVTQEKLAEQQRNLHHAQLDVKILQNQNSIQKRAAIADLFLGVIIICYVYLNYTITLTPKE